MLAFSAFMDTAQNELKNLKITPQIVAELAHCLLFAKSVLNSLVFKWYKVFLSNEDDPSLPHLSCDSYCNRPGFLPFSLRSTYLPIHPTSYPSPLTASTQLVLQNRAIVCFFKREQQDYMG